MNSFARSGPSLICLICTALLAGSACGPGIAVAPTLPLPASATPFGTQPAITCPAGAVDIRPGSSIQSIVDVHPGKTTFCLRAGTHSLRGAITPKTGNVFVGEYGAILDGTGWTTTDDTQAAFRAHNQNIDDVTIRNLVIRKMPQRGIHAYSDGACANRTCTIGGTTAADRWTIQNNEIAQNVVGVVVANGSVVRNNYIHHNVGDPTSPVHVLQGGGYQLYLVIDVLFENNEFAYNGTEQKVSLTRRVIFRNNWVHHNLRNGIWYDGENTGALIEDNIVEDNAGFGIFYEVSGQGVVRNNRIRRNGDNGIMISASHSVDIYGNTLEANLHGIVYFVDCLRIGSPEGGWIGEAFYMQNVSAHDNTITVGTQPGALANGFSYASCTSTELAPYLDGSKNLTFSRNAYRVPSLTGSYWVWNSSMTWDEWQALGYDTAGTLALR